MALIPCSTCGRQFDPAASTALPFCSERCRKIDLNRWLNEEVALPAEESPAEESMPPTNGHGDA